MHLASAGASLPPLCISLPTAGDNLHLASANPPLCKPTSVHPSANGWRRFPANLRVSLCQRLEATCLPHLPALPSNLCAFLCQRLEASASNRFKICRAFNISAYLRQRLEATCIKRFMNSDILWHVPMLLLAKLPAEHLQALSSKQRCD